MKTALQILSDEHQNILKVIEILLKECDFLQAGGEIKKTFFEKVIDFVRGYADKFHHAKEEDILFQEFNRLAEDGCVHCNPVEQMLREHDLGRNFIGNLEEGNEKNDKDKIIENARGYAQLLKEHIFKEDNILYPMADEALSQEAKEMILKKFKLKEDERIGEREKYLLFIKEINDR